MVQRGDREAAGELWLNVRKLVLKLQKKYLNLCIYCSVEPCDLEQEGFFAVLKAAEAFDPDKGYRFTSYLGWHIDNVTRKALGLRGHATRPQNVKSLDEPLPGDDKNFTLGDTIPDESAEAAFEQIQEDWQRSQLRAALEQAMEGMLPNHKASLCARFFEGRTLRSIEQERGCTFDNIRQHEQKALRYLRKPEQARQLRPFLEASDCSGYGLSAFKDRGYVSRVEVLAGTY